MRNSGCKLCKKFLLPEDVSQEELLATIDKVNKDDSIHGVLLFRPLPKHSNQSVIENALDPKKDVDCMTDGSMSGVFTGKKIGFPPCTPQACMEILDYYGIDCTGKKAVVVGRSLVVGKPAAMMLIKKNATVTVCHTRTVDMPSVVKEADIVIVAAGRAGVVDASYVSPGQTIIDVGINVNAGGQALRRRTLRRCRADRRCHHPGSRRCGKRYHLRTGRTCGRGCCQNAGIKHRTNVKQSGGIAA